jgi:hypothetical protein
LALPRAMSTERSISTRSSVLSAAAPRVDSAAARHSPAALASPRS